jgi:hypothetical protein
MSGISRYTKMRGFGTSSYGGPIEFDPPRWAS